MFVIVPAHGWSKLSAQTSDRYESLPLPIQSQCKQAYLDLPKFRPSFNMVSQNSA